MSDEKDDDILQEGVDPPPEDEGKLAVDPEVESEARKYGWKPKEEFTLAPDGWVDAGRFMELPATQLKMTRDLNRTLEKALKDKDDRLSRVETTTQAAIERLRSKLEADHAAELTRIKDEQRKAVEIGDVATFERLEAQRDSLKPVQIANAPQAPQIAPEIVEYRSKPNGAWMGNQDALRFAFMAVENNVEAKALPPLRQVEWAEKRVREYFPDLFQDQKPPPQKVDGGGLGVFGRQRSRGADDLPSEAKAIGSDFVKQGIYKSLDEYAKDYFAEEPRA